MSGRQEQKYRAERDDLGVSFEDFKRKGGCRKVPVFDQSRTSGVSKDKPVNISDLLKVLKVKI